MDAFQQLISSPSGRALIASKMVQPLRTRRDYVRCPICNKTTWSLFEHIQEMKDDEHQVFYIMEL